MHLLTIIFGPSPTPWALMFAKVELADSALTELKLKKKEGVGEVTLHDDFGQQATIDVASIHGFMLEDMLQSQLANIERQMHHERFIAKVKQQANSDQAIRSAHSQQGPAILNPMGNGRFPG